MATSEKPKLDLKLIKEETKSIPLVYGSPKYKKYEFGELHNDQLTEDEFHERKKRKKRVEVLDKSVVPDYPEGKYYTDKVIYENELFYVDVFYGVIKLRNIEGGEKEIKILLNEVFSVKLIRELLVDKLSEEELKNDIFSGVVISVFKKKSKKIVKHKIIIKNDIIFKSYILQLAFLGYVLKDESVDVISKKKRSILVIINPVSGRGNSEKMFRKKAAPILDLAHLKYNIILTEKEGHATLIASKFNFDQYNEIAIVGGDGSLHEVIQGLMNHKVYSYKQTMKIPISLFPGGGGNAISYTAGSRNTMEVAAFICARGKTSKMDLMTCIKGNKRSFCSLSVTLGVAADADLGTEHLRSLGDLRFLLGTMYYYVMKGKTRLCDVKIVKLKKQKEHPFEKSTIKNEHHNVYENIVEIDKNDLQNNVLPPCPLIKKYFQKELEQMVRKVDKDEAKEEKEENKDEENKDENKDEENKDGENKEENKDEENKEENKDEEIKDEKDENKEEKTQEIIPEDKQKRVDSIPFEKEEDGEEEIQELINIDAGKGYTRETEVIEYLETQFYQVTACNTSVLSADFCLFPHQTANSGWIDIALETRKKRGIDRFKTLMTTFTQNYLESARDDPESLQRCKAFFLDPKDDCYITIDGERVTPSPILVEIHSSLATLTSL